MKDDHDKPAPRNGAAPQVFVPGAGLPDSRRGGVAVPDKGNARTTAPAGTPVVRKTPGGMPHVGQNPTSDRPPPGAQNTATTPRTVGGRTARLKMPELDEPDDVPPAPSPPKALKLAAVPRLSPVRNDAQGAVKSAERRGGISTVKLDALDPLPPLRPAPPRLPRPAPAANTYGLDEPGEAFVPLLHEHEEPEPRQTPTVRASPAALGVTGSRHEDRARERSAREAAQVRTQLEAQMRDEERAREEQKHLDKLHGELLEEEKRAEARMREERRREARQREEQLREEALAAPKSRRNPGAPVGDPFSPPLYGPEPTALANDKPESRWTFAIAIGCVSLAIGTLLPLPFRKHIARPRDEAAAAGSASAPLASASPPAATSAAATARPAQADPGLTRPATPTVAPPPSSDTARPSGTPHIVPPSTAAQPTATGRPNVVPRKPGGPPPDIF